MSSTRGTDGSIGYELLTGIVGGIISAIVVGVVIYVGFDPDILAEGIPEGVGMSGAAAGWGVFIVIGAIAGLVYAGIAELDAIAQYAVLPRTGTYLGLVYGLVLWVIAMIVVPLGLGEDVGGVGEYAVNLQGVLSFALLGIVIGIVYGASPYTRP